MTGRKNPYRYSIRNSRQALKGTHCMCSCDKNVAEYYDQPGKYARLWTGTNYGTSSITLAAPGGDFLLPGNDVCFGPVVVQYCWVFDMVFSTIPGGWNWSAGTSMAAPHAAGVAALIIGANGSPMKPADVLDVMKYGADDLGKPGKDAAYGHGRVNANNSTP